jgi:hypothetical protein
MASGLGKGAAALGCQRGWGHRGAWNSYLPFCWELGGFSCALPRGAFPALQEAKVERLIKFLEEPKKLSDKDLAVQVRTPLL